jgi:hypothetical protein
VTTKLQLSFNVFRDYGRKLPKPKKPQGKDGKIKGKEMLQWDGYEVKRRVMSYDV